MNKLVDKLVYTIKNTSNDDKLCEAYICISEIIRKYMMGVSSEEYPEINKIEFSQEEINALRDALVFRVDKERSSNKVAGILSVLAGLGDKTLKDWYIQNLETYLVEALKYNSNLHSLEICLSMLGEEIIEGDSQCVGDYEKNIQQACKYFQKRGKVFSA